MVCWMVDEGLLVYELATALLGDGLGRWRCDAAYLAVEELAVDYRVEE